MLGTKVRYVIRILVVYFVAGIVSLSAEEDKLLPNTLRQKTLPWTDTEETCRFSDSWITDQEADTPLALILKNSAAYDDAISQVASDCVDLVAVSGTCKTGYFLYWNSSFNSIRLYFDAERVFSAITSWNHHMDPWCKGAYYWPNQTICAEATLSKIICGKPEHAQEVFELYRTYEEKRASGDLGE